MFQANAFLYVEDDPLSREIMQMILGGLGYSPLTVFENSADFLTRIEALTPRPDVIFLDIHMKPFDGFDLLKMLRAHPGFSHAITIAVTASVMNEEMVRLKDAGFDGAIGKPLDFENFASLMQRLLSGEEIWYVI
jgi:two-component system cell cycle response regulator DivK